MDRLDHKMKELSLKTVAMPAKRVPGNRGAKTEFLTNLTKLRLKPNVPFFKYDVRMYVIYKGKDGREHHRELTKQIKEDFPEQERKASAAIVYKHLVTSYPDVFTKHSVLYYDRASTLFSAHVQLKLDGEEKEFTLSVQVLPNAGDGAEKVRVVVKKAADIFQVMSNDVRRAVNVIDIERAKGVLEVLNIALSQRGYLETSQFVVYRSNTHYLYDHEAFGIRNDEIPELTDGKYIGIGVSKSVKVLEGDSGKCDLFVVADVTSSPFHADGQNLLHKISQMSIFLDRGARRSNFSVDLANRPHFVRIIHQIIKGLYVTTIYGRGKTFAIDNIATAASNLRILRVDGSQCTLVQYFKERYNIELKYPELFTVSERHQPHTYYPVELLSVAPLQRVTQRQQTPDDVAAIIKASATLPQHRLSQTEKLKNALGIAPGNSFLEDGGIDVEKDFTKVNGRVLRPPTIVYGGCRKATVGNCKWDWDCEEFLQPAKLLNWAVCATLTENDMRQVPLSEYIDRIEKRCRWHGMEVANVSEIFYLKRQNYDGLKEWYEKQKEKDRNYLLFITSDAIQLHDTIKLLEVEYQIVSQEIRTSKVSAVIFKNQNQTLDSVVAKVNQKLGGVNYKILLDLDPKYKNWLSDSRVVYIGFEISNPPAQPKVESGRGAIHKMPSVLGWGASCTANPQRFVGGYVYVEPRESDTMGLKLGEVVGDIIKKHRMATSITARHIFVYFSGIPEGEFSVIADKYMRAIYTYLASLSLGSEPDVTALAVSKDHNERIYRSRISGKRAVEQNIRGGTVIDTKIVSPVRNEFYLNAHSAFQGTAKTPKYSLIADNSQIPLDAIEGLTYGLCYLHAIVSSTVAIPIPLVVADRCAKRGHNVYAANLKEQHVIINNINDANEQLLNHGDLRKVRYNA